MEVEMVHVFLRCRHVSIYSRFQKTYTCMYMYCICVCRDQCGIAEPCASYCLSYRLAHFLHNHLHVALGLALPGPKQVHQLTGTCTWRCTHTCTSNVLRKDRETEERKERGNVYVQQKRDVSCVREWMCMKRASAEVHVHVVSPYSFSRRRWW